MIRLKNSLVLLLVWSHKHRTRILEQSRVSQPHQQRAERWGSNAALHQFSPLGYSLAAPLFNTREQGLQQAAPKHEAVASPEKTPFQLR
mmetsp:Transcript_9105/g.14391  ORF Transcript_9105/g.14391 Transcript_9105/m.14391 type:complete len:89 (-) Transcript_9105:1012-1278(-)